jgi:hypothetical protein
MTALYPDWTHALSGTQARDAARIERQLRLDAERWARLEARAAERAEDDLARATAHAANFCVGESA